MHSDPTRFISRFAAIALSIATLAIAPSKQAPAEPLRQASQPSAVQLAAADRATENSGENSGGALVKAQFTTEDEKFLDDLERRGIQFFVEEADSTTGLMPDRAKANGGAGDVASTASVGFGLTALCIGDERGWVRHQDAYDRCLRVLTFLRDHGPQAHGHFYHFLDMHTGRRVWNCEVSNIDTALLMAGVLTVRQHFPNSELATVANDLFERVDWPWLASGDGTLYMGWKPETEFIKARWDSFNEGSLIYLLAMGSRTHALPPQAWRAWRREPVITYAGLTFMQCPPLFTHQYTQAWFDLRGQRDDFADYFRNSQLATLAQRQWCIDELSKHFPTYGPNFWGITASDSKDGYQAWGGPPQQGKIDGSIVPSAVAGSLVFEPRLCLDALHALRDRYGKKIYLKYGFIDAFNPAIQWYNTDVIGIDIGPSVLMAENCRSGFVWKTFMSSAEATAAMKAAGFRPENSQERTLLATGSLFNQGNK